MKNKNKPSKIADHRIVNQLRLAKIPEEAIQEAKKKLHIAYGHTSHGSQLITGMNGLAEYAKKGFFGEAYSEDLFDWEPGGKDNALDLQEGDQYGSGPLDHDAGYFARDWETNGHEKNWYLETIEFLEDPDNSEVNVIIWSWCGQASKKTEQSMIDEYLAPMIKLEEDYPEITFVYMTGHLDGTGEEGNLYKRNNQIREYCIDNNKWLYDFADIESYDPEGNYYLDKNADDECNYDGGNWAKEWQESHTEGQDWYKCKAAHTQPLNANMKAYAAWWLWTRIGGWDGSTK